MGVLAFWSIFNQLQICTEIRVGGIFSKGYAKTKKKNIGSISSNKEDRASLI